jgi:SAM-dependent methyltransferase
VHRFVARVATFVDEQLDPPARVLEVGAGNGALAAMLRLRGHDVVAIDLTHHSAAAGVIVADAATFTDAEPFDAVVFSQSLHHLAEAETTLRHLAGLLGPGGRFFVDELFWDQAGRPEAELLHDTLALLVSTGHVIHPPTPALGGDPLAWWFARHEMFGVHSGARMEAWLSEIGQVTWREQMPFVARWFAPWLTPGPASESDAVIDELERMERRRIKACSLSRLGRHLMIQVR